MKSTHYTLEMTILVHNKMMIVNELIAFLEKSTLEWSHHAEVIEQEPGLVAIQGDEEITNDVIEKSIAVDTITEFKINKVGELSYLQKLAKLLLAQYNVDITINAVVDVTKMFYIDGEIK